MRVAIPVTAGQITSHFGLGESFPVAAASAPAAPAAPEESPGA